MVRTLTQATPLSLDAKRALKISTKSQILHWKRHGTADGVRGFKGHFNNIAGVSRFFKRGGYVTIAIDGVLTTDTIVEACQTESQRHCHRTMAVEGQAMEGELPAVSEAVRQRMAPVMSPSAFPVWVRVSCGAG